MNIVEAYTSIEMFYQGEFFDGGERKYNGVLLNKLSFLQGIR